MAVQTLFDHATVVPTSFAEDANTTLTLGTRFYFAVPGTISAIAFYKSAAHNSTTLVVRLYSQTGTVLGEGTLTDVPLGAGWVTVPLTAPVAVDALTAYLAAVWYPNAAYPYQSDAFSGVEIVRGDIHGIDAEDSSWGDRDNGRFHYGASEIIFPTGASRANFFIDVLFEAEGDEVLPITGTANLTEADDTLSSSGALRITGSASITEQGDSLSASGVVRISGSCTLTDSDDTLTASATIALRGQLTVDEDDDELLSTVEARLSVLMAAQEDDDRLVSTGQLRISGTASLTESNDTLLATGAQIRPPIEAMLDVVEADDTLQSTIVQLTDLPIERPNWKGRVAVNRTWATMVQKDSRAQIKAVLKNHVAKRVKR